MATVFPQEKSPSYKTWGQVLLSTAADGVTAADVLDTCGLAISAIQPGTNASTACTYTLKGSMDSTANLGLLYTSSGALWSFGSTSVDPRGAVFSQDPAFFMGVRYVQLVSNTTSAAAPNAVGAQAKIFLSAYGQVK
jgi:hypothetical protein